MSESTSGDLSVQVSLARHEFTVAAELEIPAGESVAVLGPNGAGKSTLLSLVAGLLAPDAGQIRLGGRLLTDVDDDRQVLVAPEHRRVGLMGQDPLLFPHLSALENVAFGPRSQGRGRSAARASAGSWLERMGLSAFASLRPAQLSGGQRQRVALARALAAEPHVLLLDEPLGALDAQTVPEIRQVLRTHLRDSGTTSLLVTHDVLDAAVLADRVIVLERGAVVDDGPTRTVLTAPRSSFGATLAGLNLVTGIVAESVPAARGASLTTTYGLVLTGIAAPTCRREMAAAASLPAVAVSVFGGLARRQPAQSLAHRDRLARAGDRGGPAPDAGARRSRSTSHRPRRRAGLTPGTTVVLSVKATEVMIHQR